MLHKGEHSTLLYAQYLFYRRKIMKKICLCSFIIIISFFVFVACADSDINLGTTVDNDTDLESLREENLMLETQIKELLQTISVLNNQLESIVPWLPEGFYSSDLWRSLYEQPELIPVLGRRDVIMSFESIHHYATWPVPLETYRTMGEILATASCGHWTVYLIMQFELWEIDGEFQIEWVPRAYRLFTENQWTVIE